MSHIQMLGCCDCSATCSLFFCAAKAACSVQRSFLASAERNLLSWHKVMPFHFEGTVVCVCVCTSWRSVSLTLLSIQVYKSEWIFLFFRWTSWKNHVETRVRDCGSEETRPSQQTHGLEGDVWNGDRMCPHVWNWRCQTSRSRRVRRVLEGTGESGGGTRKSSARGETGETFASCLSRLFGLKKKNKKIEAAIDGHKQVELLPDSFPFMGGVTNCWAHFRLFVWDRMVNWNSARFETSRRECDVEVKRYSVAMGIDIHNTFQSPEAIAVWRCIETFEKKWSFRE